MEKTDLVISIQVREYSGPANGITKKSFSGEIEAAGFDEAIAQLSRLRDFYRAAAGDDHDERE